jgi:dTDP-4-dehydrorhamnose 3,5-epimerase
MIFKETTLKGAYIIELDKLEDERGFFARSYCLKEFEKHGLNPRVVQCNISYNAKKGTLRGMHYQYPKWEAKLVRVTRGSIFDVIIDLRSGSPSYTQHFSVTLSDENRKMLFIPEGFAHGFQTLEDHTEIFYQMSEFYYPGNDRGIRYDDAVFGIRWPEDVNSISERDRSYPDFIP